MIVTWQYDTTAYQIDLSKPTDLSIALKGDVSGINAWDIPPPKIVPYQQGDFVGSVNLGAAVNFNMLHFNPHSHITHTECVGHITKQVFSVNKQLLRYFFFAALITVVPEQSKDDLVISRRQLQDGLGDKKVEALIIRTLPNTKEKRSREYTNTNPPYLLEEAAEYLSGIGIQHLLVDLPSVDKEKDDGALLAHKAFWNTHGKLRMGATITEFIYVPDTIADGTYLLNLQVAPIENDASPSRPVIYKMIKS